MASRNTILHLRSETKAHERRSACKLTSLSEYCPNLTIAVSPFVVKSLIDAGYTVNVEKSPERIFDDEEFEAVGATLADEGTWIEAPKDHVIVGLKELETKTFPLHHKHIQFGHCYKKQDGWESYLSRFARGDGLLYDIEFLTDASGRRVSAFGYWAGYAGTSIALLAWSNQIRNPGTQLGSISSYQSQSDLVKTLKSSTSAALTITGDFPRVLVIGALGRCGTGAVDACRDAGVPDTHIIKWDMAETAKGGPFEEILQADVFVNCIYLSTKIPPFVTLETLAKPGRKLRVVCDVSCDPNNPNNPVPIYKECSTFKSPAIPIAVEGGGPLLTHVSIDHMPSLLPREASEMFSENLLPSLLLLDERNQDGVWTRAEKLYHEKVEELPAEMRAEQN